jgi:hypothetical protein
MVFLCAPVYVTGLGLLLLFGAGIAASGIGIVPLEYVPFEESPLRWLGSMIVPWIVLGLPLAALLGVVLAGTRPLGDDTMMLVVGVLAAAGVALSVAGFVAARRR